MIKKYKAEIHIDQIYCLRRSCIINAEICLKTKDDGFEVYRNQKNRSGLLGMLLPWYAT